MSSNLACCSQECRVTKGQQTCVPHEQIEGAGEERKAQDVHEKDRINEKRRHNEKPGHARERNKGETAGLLGCAADGLGRGLRGACHAVLPNRPAGLIIRTIAMMMKTIVLEASG